MRRIPTVGIVAGALAAAIAACSPPAEPPDQAPKVGSRLETVDVSAPPDAEADLAADRHEPAVGGARGPGAGPGGIAGVLPDGFPRDVPLPRPSSLVDFDDASVTLEVSGQLEGVRTAYLRQLAGAGFAARDGGRWQRGSRALRVAFAAAAGATRVTVEIVPAS